MRQINLDSKVEKAKMLKRHWIYVLIPYLASHGDGGAERGFNAEYDIQSRGLLPLLKLTLHAYASPTSHHHHGVSRRMAALPTLHKRPLGSCLHRFILLPTLK
jgi:hypothetical protein